MATDYDRKKYKAKSHKKGGQLIDTNGNPTSTKPIAEIELSEVMVRDGDSKYIFSDQLGIAEKVRKNLEKLKGNQSLEENSRRVVTDYYKKQNEVLRQQAEAKESQASGVEQMALGGMLASAGISLIPALINELKGDEPQAMPTNENAFPYGIDIPKYAVGGIMREVPLIGTGPVDPLNPNPLSVTSQTTNPLDAFPNPTPAATSPATTGLPVTPSSGFNIDVPTILRAVSGGASIIDSLGRSEVVDPQVLDTSRGDALVAGTGSSAAPQLNAIQRSTNAANKAARGTAGTVQSYLNNLRQNQATAAQTSSEAIQRNKQYNDQVALSRAGREDRNATIRMQENIRTDVANEQNRAMRKDLIQNSLNQIDSIASGIDRKNKLEEQMQGLNDKNKRDYLLKLAAMRLVNPNFKPGDIQKVVDGLANETISVEDAANQLINFVPDGQ